MILALGIWLALALGFAALNVQRPSRRRRDHAAGLWDASLWVEDATDRLTRDSAEWRWLMGSAGFLRQLAREQCEHVDLVAPFSVGWRFRHRRPRRIFPA